MPWRARVLTALLLVSLSSFACGGQPPTKEMQDAQTAIDAALAAGADKYASEEYAFAQEAIQRARAAVKEGDYRLALSSALDSRERAQLAAQEATAKKAAAKAESEKAIASVRALIATAQTRITGAEADRAAAAGLAAPKSALAAAEQHVQEAGAAFEQGDYVKANTQSAAALQALAAVSTGLDALSPRRRR